LIAKLIFEWANKTPDKTAMIYNGRAWSYRSFAQLVAAARAYFARVGYVGPGYAVLAIDHLMSFWILSLALRSLGLTTIAVPGGAAAATAVGKVLPTRCVIISPREAQLLDLFSESITDKPAQGLDAFDTHLSGGHILLTSGTTGIYKMVLMRSVFDEINLGQRVEVFGINADSRFNVFNLAPWTGGGYGWPASTWTVGGAVVIEQAGQLCEALLRPEITHAVVTPPMLDEILAAPPSAFPRNEHLQLAVGGGTMTSSQLAQSKARITPRVLNWLGSTEAGVIAFTPLDTVEDRKWHRLTPGRIIEVVDETGRRVPTGKTGRLRVSTAGGWPTEYLGDEEATRVFFKDGYFYPGDLAVMRADGRIALQGRITDVINVRGNKISPAPIEDRLGELLGVSGVCLFSTQNDSGDEEIHVIIETSNSINSERVMAALKRELHGLDRACIRQVAALPRNQMGKVLRQEVRADVIASQTDSFERSRA
jgi:acyl-coenzyme A synthetase/AMP-(fatty) acid ligase